MTEKTENFATFMFQELYGNVADENNKPYIEVYQYEIEELLKGMYHDLLMIFKVFGEYTLNDVITAFVLNFWDPEGIVHQSINQLRAIAYEYVTITNEYVYGDIFRDEPTFG